MSLVITLTVCITLLLIMYMLTKFGVTINMTYTNKNARQNEPLIEPIENSEDKHISIDGVLAEIYDAFDINVDKGEDGN